VEKQKKSAFLDFCRMVGLNLHYVRRMEGMNQADFIDGMKLTTVKNSNMMTKIETGRARRLNMEMLAAIVWSGSSWGVVI